MCVVYVLMRAQIRALRSVLGSSSITLQLYLLRGLSLNPELALKIPYLCLPSARITGSLHGWFLHGLWESKLQFSFLWDKHFIH